MSIESVRTIIERAATEPEFRDLLFGDPDKALEGYELTEEEKDALKSLDRDKFDSVASELGERISRVGIAMSANGERGFRLSIDGGESWP